MHSDKRRELLELQIALRTLKMEKLDLNMQNCQMRQIAIEARRQSEEKDKEILEMRQQLEAMRRALNKKHREASVSPEKTDFSLRSLPKQPLTLMQDNLPATDRAAPPVMPTSFSSRRLSEVQISTLDKVRDLWKPTLKSKQVSENTVDFLTKYLPTHEEPRAKTPKVLTVTLERPSRSSSAIGKRQPQAPVSVNGGYITSNKRGAFSYLHQIKSGRTRSASKRPVSRGKTCVEPAKCLDLENTERPFEFSSPETPLSRVSADYASRMVRRRWNYVVNC
jgi:hypothetical protein